MTNIYHNPIPNTAKLDSVTFNVALGELDQAIADLVSGELNWIVRGSSPGTPGTGFAKLYFKSDGLYFLTSTGVETLVGGTISSGGLIELESNDTITISTIPTGYKQLELKLRLRTDYAAAQDQILIQFNNDITAANYNSASFDGTTLNTATGTASGIKIWSVAGNSGEAGLFALIDPLMIFDYASPTHYKSVDYRGMCIPYSSLSTGYAALSGGGVWLNSANPITSIHIKPVNGTVFLAGSSYELLAIG